MKKFFLLIAAISISLGAMSQKGKVTSALSLIDQGQLDKAKEAIDQAIANEKTVNYANTYFAQGRLCQEVFKSDNPKFKELCPNPLQQAYASYEKALSLDEKGALKKRLITGMIYNNLAVDLYNQGSQQFEAQDFTGALQTFETQIKVTESDNYAGAIDTGMYYNAGLAAVNSSKYPEAIKYFEKCTEMGYMGVTPYFQIYESYLGLKDTAKAEATLLELPKKFPNDKSITLNLIDLYIKSGKNNEALKYIDQAKADDPNNATLYFAAGIIYLNVNNYDAAIKELTKSIELNPNLYDTQYGLGAAYINKASDMFTKANEIMDVNKYSQAIDEANAVYAKALPYMEKALELKPDDVYTLRSLQELYYRLRQKDPSLNAKYEEVRAKLSKLETK
ncbi:MAG TPA: tetratricopeptide repeat protein [Bacteroidales bacterium]|nr:tetratricopeptide repeat protein [Bacteroidales bacterium]